MPLHGSTVVRNMDHVDVTELCDTVEMADGPVQNQFVDGFFALTAGLVILILGWSRNVNVQPLHGSTAVMNMDHVNVTELCDMVYMVDMPIQNKSGDRFIALTACLVLILFVGCSRNVNV